MADEDEIEEGTIEDESDRTQEMIDYLSGLSIEASQMIPKDRQELLIAEMHKFFQSHCDENQMLNFLEMVFIFSRALRFALIKITQECEGCEHCASKFDSGKETIH